MNRYFDDSGDKPIETGVDPWCLSAFPFKDEPIDHHEGDQPECDRKRNSGRHMFHAMHGAKVIVIGRPGRLNSHL